VAKRTAGVEAETPADLGMRYLPCRDLVRGCAINLGKPRSPAWFQGSIMLLTIFCSISTGLALYCILTRVHRRNIEIAVRLAVREAEKEFENRTVDMLAKLSAKETELHKVRNLVKLHEAVPTLSVPRPAAPAMKAPAARGPDQKLKQDPLNVFEMSSPFTETRYNQLLANSDVVKIEPAGG
jgi:hypothetical protein